MFKVPLISARSANIFTSAILAALLGLSACTQPDNSGANLPILNPEQALLELGFDINREENKYWSRHSGENGDYSFYDVTLDLPDEGAALSIEQLDLKGVTMGPQGAVFHNSVLSGVNIKDADSWGRIDTVNLSEPNAAMARFWLNWLSEFQGDNPLSAVQQAADFEQKLTFNALTLEALEISSDKNEGRFEVKSMAMQDLTSESLGKIQLKDMNFSSQNMPASTGAIALSFSEFMAEGLKLSDEDISAQMLSFNPYELGVESFSLTDLSLQAMGVSLSLGKASRSTQRRGDIVTIKQELNKAVIDGGDMLGPLAAIRAMGYEQLNLDGYSETILDEGEDLITLSEAYLNLQDGARLSFAGQISGYGEAHLKQQALLEENQSTDIDDEDAKMEQLLKSFELQGEMQDILANSLSVHNLKITLDDQGLTPRALSLAADLQGTEPARLIDQLTGAALMYSMMAQNDVQAEILDQSFNAVTDFLKNPGVLEFSLNPDSPLKATRLQAIMGVGDPDQTIPDFDDLGFNVENRP